MEFFFKTILNDRAIIILLTANKYLHLQKLVHQMDHWLPTSVFGL